MEKIKIDVAVIGEGEETIKELFPALEGSEALHSVRGICFKEEGIHCTSSRELIENLDDIPFPAWELFPLKIHLNSPSPFLF